MTKRVIVKDIGRGIKATTIVENTTWREYAIAALVLVMLVAVGAAVAFFTIAIVSSFAESNP